MESTHAIKSDLDRLLKQQAETERLISDLRTALNVIARYEQSSIPVTRDIGLAPATPSALSVSASSQNAERPSTKPADIAKAAAHVLQQQGWTLLPDLCQRVQSMGLTIGGKDAVGNLSTILSRHKSQLGLQSDRQRGWALKDVAS